MSQSDANPNAPRDAAIDAAYRESARESPPRALDDRILAAAHRAVAARPAPVRPDWTRRWRVPLSVAATLVLSATITLMVYESDDAPPLAPARPQASGGAQREAPRSELQMRERAAQAERSTEPKAAAPRPDERPAPEPQIGAAAGKPAAPQAAAPGASPPVPFPADDRAKRSTPAQEERDQATPLARERAPAAPPPPPPSAAPRKREAESAASAAARRDAATATEDRALADRPAGRAGGVAPAPSPAPAHSAAPATMPAWTPPSGRALDLTAPEGWVEEIRWLKREARHAEAAIWLSELKARFPDYALPDDLR